MKLKSLFTIGALVAVASTGLNAQTVIRISASNGDRGPTQTAISKILASGWTFQGINGSTSSSGTLSTATGANYGAWKGTYAGNPVVIKVSYSGALAGIAAVASNPKIPQRYVKTDGSGSGSVPDPTLPATLPADYEEVEADFGFSTNFQSTSPFNGSYNEHQYDSLVEEIVGVSPLGFYASPGFPTSAANITTQQAQLLYSTGALPLAYFTGNYTTDANKIVYAIGRDTNAGQRFGAYTEIGLGTSSLVRVWQPTISGQNTSFSGIPFGGTVTSHIPWPAETVGGVDSPRGAGGFSTGASLAPTLTRTITGTSAIKGTVDGVELFPNATAAYYIGYLTPGDALTRVLGVGDSTTTPLYDGGPNTASRGVALSFNGVPLHNAVNGNAATVNFDNVRNGKYTAWLYNRILKTVAFNNLPSTNVKKAFADALQNQITNTDATVGGGIKLDTFSVERSTDGGLVTPLY